MARRVPFEPWDVAWSRGNATFLPPAACHIKKTNGFIVSCHMPCHIIRHVWISLEEHARKTLQSDDNSYIRRANVFDFTTNLSSRHIS